MPLTLNGCPAPGSAAPVPASVRTAPIRTAPIRTAPIDAGRSDSGRSDSGRSDSGRSDTGRCDSGQSRGDQGSFDRRRGDDAQTGCVPYAPLFQHPLLEDPPTGSASAEIRRHRARLVSQAKMICHGCPLIAPCLYRAVVEHDVAGFAGGTTARQRSEIRGRLAIRVEPEDFDTLAGVTGRHRQIDHDEVVRLRNANPQESLEVLAHRLDCSLSTVKRHLRRERSNTSPTAEPPTTPTLAQVVAAAAEVTGGALLGRTAA